ncbi:MAG: histidine phosphatase family protein [Planctomycetota bacterium]
MRLVFIRHGEMQGDPWCRPSRPVSGCLSERGIAQATATGRALAGRSWHHVFASPLGRALQTAEIVCGQTAPITILDCLQEWLPNPDLVKAPSTVWEEMMRRDANRPVEELWQTNAGEGTYSFFGRVVPGVLHALDAIGCHPRHGGYVLDDGLANAQVAIVAHGGSLGVLLTHLLGLRPFPASSFGFQLAGVAELELFPHAGVCHVRLICSAPGSEI